MCNPTLLRRAIKTITIVFSTWLCGIGLANDVKIVDVAIQPAGNNQYRVSVTLLHEDTGWEHYANRWDVLNEQGELLGSRTLAHPHVNEQPFTRSLTLQIPSNVKTLTIVAGDSVHGDSAETVTIAMPE